MTTFIDEYLKKESTLFDSCGNRKRFADQHSYAKVVELANRIAIFKNSINQECAKVLIDQARKIKELQDDNSSYVTMAYNHYSDEQRHNEQMRDQCGGY